MEKVEEVKQPIINNIASKITNITKSVNIPIVEKVSANEEKVWLNDVLRIIEKHESLYLTSYCDELYYGDDGKYYKDYNLCENGGRRSIGRGTRSYKGEVITEQEADRRALEFLNPYVKEVDSYSCYTDMQKTAIVDFMYNSGKYTKHNITGLTFDYYVKRCDKEVIKGFLAPYNYSSAGLKKRRQSEYNFFLGINKI